jgi:hypothetical protein
MTHRKQKAEAKRMAGAAFGVIGAGAAALILGLAVFTAPRTADALPSYAQQTGLACGACHVNPAGGGPRNAFGKSFAANGHKVPASGPPSAPTAGTAGMHSALSETSLPYPTLPHACYGWCLEPGM